MPSIWSKAVLTNLVTHYIHHMNPQITSDSFQNSILHSDEAVLLNVTQAWREGSEQEQGVMT